MVFPLVDREELRKDKAVEVPFDEVEELISELLRENESFAVRGFLVSEYQIRVLPSLFFCNLFSIKE